MYDAYLNDVSYVSQVSSFGSFYKITFISVTSCLLMAGESVLQAVAHTAVIGLQ